MAFECFQVDGGWRVFKGRFRVIEAGDPESVPLVIALVERLCSKLSLYAFGFVAYEASKAFDPSMGGRFRHLSHPYARFTLYRYATKADAPPAVARPRAYSLSGFRASSTCSRYIRAFHEVKAALSAGMSYQCNLTLRLRARFSGDPYAFFLALLEGQPSSGYAAYLEGEGYALCSVSPELFFERKGGSLSMKPMKGSAARRPGLEDGSTVLASSLKDRAENVMIVDMVRNDLGRIAEHGSVRVESLFDVESHASIHQMTSKVVATSASGLASVFSALFPSASVTGAPKRSTMRLIEKLEDSPRGAYCGAIGMIEPNGDARFSVAIRTAIINRVAQEARYGIGSGVVWDSGPLAELKECFLKARPFLRLPEPFSIYETMLWRPGFGYYLLDRHRERIRESASFFGYPFDSGAFDVALIEAAVRFSREPMRVRLILSEGGTMRLDYAPIREVPFPHTPILGIATRPVSALDPFLGHKTTRPRALLPMSGCDDAILYNEEGELTETLRANIALLKGGRLVTPPLACGLLPGTMRAELIERGILIEGKLELADLAEADSLWLFNAVRGLLRAPIGSELRALASAKE